MVSKIEEQNEAKNFGHAAGEKIDKNIARISWHREPEAGVDKHDGWPNQDVDECLEDQYGKTIFDLTDRASKK